MAKNFGISSTALGWSFFSPMDGKTLMSIDGLRKCFYTFFSGANKCYGDKDLNRAPGDSELAPI